MRAGAVCVALWATACVRAPSPLAPQLAGSIGSPSRGVLTGAAELPKEGEGYKWLRQDDRHWGLARFTGAIERAAASVARERPGGAPLMIGDLSVHDGGQLSPHFSHRTGRDADLLLFVVTLDGAPVESPGFIHFGNDGLAWDDKHKRFLRFDVEREWLLLRALLTDPEARVQWAFASRTIEALLTEWALARGEPGEIVWRAVEVMLQPEPGGVHDDHLHVRTACTEEEVAAGCEPTGPERPWNLQAQAEAAEPRGVGAPPVEPSTDELVAELVAPFAPGMQAGH